MANAETGTEAPVLAAASEGTGKPTRHFVEGGSGGSGDSGSKPFRIVLIAGFETFNRDLYRRAADQAPRTVRRAAS